jgi:flagellar hook capping protein FlgD
LSDRTCRVIAPAALIISFFLTASAEASALQRMAAGVDMGRIASAVQFNVPAQAASDALLLEPLTAELTAPTTEFRIHVSADTVVRVEVTNEAGECVCSARMLMPAGVQKVGFSGRDASGHLLPNGSYHYTVIAGDAMQTARVSIVR